MHKGCRLGMWGGWIVTALLVGWHCMHPTQWELTQLPGAYHVLNPVPPMGVLALTWVLALGVLIWLGSILVNRTDPSEEPLYRVGRWFYLEVLVSFGVVMVAVPTSHHLLFFIVTAWFAHVAFRASHVMSQLSSLRSVRGLMPMVAALAGCAQVWVMIAFSRLIPVTLTPSFDHWLIGGALCLLGCAGVAMYYWTRQGSTLLVIGIYYLGLVPVLIRQPHDLMGAVIGILIGILSWGAIAIKHRQQDRQALCDDERGIIDR